MGGVLIASMINVSLEATYDNTFHHHIGHLVTVANAQESKELTISIQKQQEVIDKELQTSKEKDEAKKTIQDEEKVAYEKAEALRIEEERQKAAEEEARKIEEARQAAIQKENYYKSINPFYNKNMKIKTSFYSENEKTDVPGHEVLTCTGINLFNGVIAAPKEIPLYSIFLINSSLYIVLDRGNDNIIKKLDKDESGAEMKVDIYVPNATSKQLLDKGVLMANSKIIRYGGSKENLNKDRKKIEEYNTKLSNGEEVDLYSVFN